MVAGVHCVVAIDGPAASGKSSVARELARRLGFAYLNSGALYRAITWYLLQRGVDPRDRAAIVQTIGSVRLNCRIEANELRVRIDDVDPTNHLRDDPVNRAVSPVSTVPEVRQIATAEMRRCAKERSLVVEGRDIGSVVFPGTPHKFYIDAAPDVRSRRRAAEGFLDEIAARDRVDSSRRASPLVVADDAHVIDTSNLTIDEVVDQILARLRKEHLPIPRRMNFYYWLGYHLSRMLARVFFGFRIIHRERMIQRGPVILAMNHQSYFDPPLAGNASDRAIYFLAKKSLLRAPVLGPILPKLNVIPVELEKTDRSALKAVIRILRDGHAVLVFPEGSRTPDGSLQPALPGLGLIIAKTRAPVVPMRIFGAFDAWPIGGKIRLGPRITIVVGEPIHFSDADLERGGRDVYGSLSRRVMDAIAALQLPAAKVDNRVAQQNSASILQQ